MSRKGLRRLDLWLPEHHPIWSLPVGRRAERARELIDLGLRLERGFDALRRDVAGEIAALREEFHVLRQGQPPAAPASRPAGASADVARRFLAAFD